jgi:hypothetical protein
VRDRAAARCCRDDPQHDSVVVPVDHCRAIARQADRGAGATYPLVSAHLDTGSVDALYARLRRDGITHVAVVAAPTPIEVANKIAERETALTIRFTSKAYQT